MQKLRRKLRSFMSSARAVSALEYAILVGVIAIAVGAAVFAFGEQIEAALEAIGGRVGAVDTGAVDTDGDG